MTPVLRSIAYICLLLATAIVPAIAQRAAETIPGRIIAIDATHNLLRVELLLHVTNGNAPGKMPAEMAQQAATLADQADQIEAQANANAVRLMQEGHTDRATAVRQRTADLVSRLRRKVEEFRHWRATEITLSTATPLIGVTRTPLSQVTTGTLLRLLVSTDTPPANGSLPGAVTLAKDALQIFRRNQAGYRPLASVRGVQRGFYDLNGEVTSANPLVVTVNGQSVRVDNPANQGLIQQQLLSMRNLQANMRIFARAALTGETQVGTVQRLLVYQANIDTTITPNNDLPL
ncbi:MAG TPA: hypothetical protein VGL77_14945 [Armatimonadota bacterium]|jgi:hypothetical protein